MLRLVLADWLARSAARHTPRSARQEDEALRTHGAMALTANVESEYMERLPI